MDGRPYWGLGNEATAEALRRDHGEQYVVVSIGPGGEAQLGAAGIAVTDANDQPFRLAARGGLGAVMGSKGLEGHPHPAHSGHGQAARRGARRDHRLPQARGVQRAHQGAAGLRHRLDGDADAEPGRAAHAQLQRRPLRRRRSAQRRSLARPHPGPWRRGHADRSVHGRLRDPVQQHHAGCGWRAGGRAAGVRDAGAVRLQPGAGFAGRHRPHQPAVQRPGTRHHRDRRGAGRDDGGSRGSRRSGVCRRASTSTHCRASATASAQPRSWPRSDTEDGWACW